MTTTRDASREAEAAPTILASVPVRFVFPYHATIVRRRCRRLTEEMFFQTDLALIPAVRAPAAYRIVFPATQNRHADKHYIANEMDILYYDDHFYWPFEAAPYRAAGARGWLDACQRWLLDRRDILGLLDHDEQYPQIAIEDVPVRELVSTDREAMCTRAKEKIQNNLISCDGRIYQRGGAPAYIKRRYFNAKIGVAAISSGHRVAAPERGLRRPAGDADGKRIQERLQRGATWAPNQRRAAKEIAERLQTVSSMPMIQIVDKIADANRMSAATAQTDALFAETMALADISPRVHEWRCELRASKDPLLCMDEGAMTDRQLTKRRLTLLRDCNDSLSAPRTRYYVDEAGRDRLDRLLADLFRFKPEKRLKKYVDVSFDLKRTRPNWPAKMRPPSPLSQVSNKRPVNETLRKSGSAFGGRDRVAPIFENACVAKQKSLEPCPATRSRAFAQSMRRLAGSLSPARP